MELDEKVVIEFDVPGKPMAKPRMTQRDKWQKRPCVMRYRSWCDLASECFEKALNQAGFTSGLSAYQVDSLSWVAHFEPPKTWSGKRRTLVLGELHRSRPDRDNIDKAVLDSLFPHGREGDSAIAQGCIKKLYSEESKVVIRIELV